MANEEFKISLGVELDPNASSSLKKDIDNIKIEPIKLTIDPDIKKQLNSIKQQVKEINKTGSSNNNILPISSTDFSKISNSFKKLDDFIDEIKISIGSLGKDTNMKPLITSINEISTALSEVSAQFKELSNSFNGFNLNLSLSGSKNPIAANAAYGKKARTDTIPQLKAQFEYLQDLLGGQEKVISQFLKNMNQFNGVDMFAKVQQMLGDMNDSSLSKQMDAYRQYIDYMKQIAKINNVDLGGFNSKFSKSADELIDTTRKIQTGETDAEESMQRLQKIFGGSSIDAEGLTSQLEQIILKLKEIGEATQKLASGISVDGLTESFNNLSSSIQQLVNNCTIVKTAVGDAVNQPIANSNVTKQFDQIVDKARSASSELNNVRFAIDEESLSNMKSALHNFGLDGSSISKVTESLDSTFVKIKQIDTALNTKDHTLEIKVTGLDELGRVVKQTEIVRQKIEDGKIVEGEFDIDTSPIVRISQSFDDGAKSAERFKQIIETITKGRLDLDSSNIETSLSKIEVKSDELKNALVELDTATKELEVAQKQNDPDVLISSWNNYENALEKVNNQIKININNQKQAADAQKKFTAAQKFDYDVQALYSKMDIWLSKNSAATKEFGAKIEELKAKLKSCDATQLNGIKSEFEEVKRKAELAGKTALSLGDKLKKQFKQYSAYISVASMFNYAERALRSMYDNVVEVDTAMTNLYKVTDETADRYDQFLNSASKNAQELGRSMSSYIEQTANWAKMGFDISESEELSKISSIYANVADVDDATAVSDMVTAMKAFNIEASNAVTVIDPLNKLSNEFAVTAAGLGQGLSKSASSMATAGTDMNKTLALLTGIAEITQSPEEAGNFLKTASMRLRGMKGELEELNEEVDSSVDSISKVQTQILNLTHGEVNIFDDSGNFRDVYEIWKDIAEIRDELSSTEIATLDEILFGKNRANQGAAMMQAFQSGQIEKAYQAALDSAGSAYAEQEKWAESLEAKLGELKAAWEGLSTTFLKSDFLKGLIDGLTNFVNVLDAIIDKLGTLPTLLGAIAGITALKSGNGIFTVFDTELNGIINKLGVFGKSFKDIMRDAKSGHGFFTSLFSNINYKDGITKNDVDCISNFMTQIKNGIPTTRAWVNTMTGATVAGKKMAVQVKSGAVELSTLTKSANTSKIAMIGLRVGIAALDAVLTMGLSIAIQALVAGLDKLVHSAKYASEAADELKKETMESSDAAQEETKQLDELIEKYKELAESETQDSSIRTEIKDIQSDITDLVGKQASNLDLVNGKLDEEYAKLIKIREEKAKDAVETATSSYHSAKDSASKAIGKHSIALADGYEFVGDIPKEMKKALKDAGFAEALFGNNLFKTGIRISNFTDSGFNIMNGFDVSTIQGKIDALDLMIETLKSVEGYAGTDLYNGLVAAKDYYQNYADDVTESAQQLIDSIIIASEFDNKLMKINVDSVETFDAYRDKLIELVQNSPDLAEALINGDVTAESIEQSVTDYLATNSQFSDYYEAWKKELDKSTNEAIEYTEEQKRKVINSFGGIAKVGADGKKIYEPLTAFAKEAYQEYKNTLDEANQLGIDTNQTIFGNIDTNNRQIIEWTKDSLSEHKDALESLYSDMSWDEITKDFLGTASTVIGSYGEYDGVEIAFSPMLQTENGAVLLDQNTIDEYIFGLIDKAGEGWTNEDLLRLDTKGLEIDGQMIKGLIADIGETAEQTSQAMHFVGKDGAIAKSFKSIETHAAYAGVSVDKLLDSLSKNEEIQDWFDTLTPEKQNLVYKIGLEADDTTLWTLTRWQQELTDMSNAGKSSAESLQEFYDILNNTEDGNFKDTVNEYISQYETFAEALGKLKSGELTEKDIFDLQLLGLDAKVTDDVNTLTNAIWELLFNTDTELMAYFADQIKAVGGASTTAGKEISELKNSASAVFDSLVTDYRPDWDKSFDIEDFNIEDEIEQFNNLRNAMDESTSSTGLATESIKSLKARYKDVSGYNPAKLFEETTHGIHLNKEALEDLEAEYEKGIKDGIQEHLDGLLEKYDELNDSIVEAKENGDLTSAIKLAGERDELINEIQNVQTLSAQYSGLVSNYNKWIEAKSGGNERDSYESLGESYEEMKEILDSGWHGDESLNAYIDTLIAASRQTGNTADDFALLTQKIAGTNHSIMDYWQFGKDGNLTTKGLQYFIQDINSVLGDGYANFNEETKKWQFDFDGIDENTGKAKMEMIAEYFGLGTEAVELFERALIDAGWAIDLGQPDPLDIDADSIENKLQIVQGQVDITNKKLKELGKEPIDINIEANTVEEVESDISEAKTALSEFINKDGTVKIGFETEYASALSVLNFLIQRKVALETPTFMSVEVENVENTELKEALALIQNYQTALNELKTLQNQQEQGIQVDTTAIETAQTKVDEATTAFAEFVKTASEDTKVSLGITMPETGDLSIESLRTTISNITAEVFVDAKPKDASTIQTEIQAQIDSTGATVTIPVKTGDVDDATVKTYQETEHSTDGTFTWNNDPSNVDAWINQTHDATGEVEWGNDTTYVKTHFEATGTIKWSGSAPRYSGTAHAYGSAFAKGDWRVKKTETALTGELGQELVVYGNKYWTVGDYGAEFATIPKGAIVFNHRQTEELFKYGKINNRGKAISGGTAFAEGTALNIGTGGFADIVEETTSASNKSSSSSSSKKKKSSSKKSNNSDAAEEFEETLDWIEIAIDRIERAISKLDTKVNSTYRSWSSRNNNLKNEISKVGEEIDLQQQAYDRYIKQAESVGLDESYAKLVRDGTIDIETITDEELAEKIDLYREWHEKALDAKDAIVELEETESELYETAFNNIVTQYEGFLSVIEHERNMLEEYISQSEASGYIVSTKYYDALINVEKANVAKLEEEKEALLTSLEEAVNSGTIKPDSEAWFEMCNQIDEVTLAILEANTSLIEFNNSVRDIEWQIFDLLQEKFSQVTDEANFLIDLLSNDKLYDDRGQLTDEGMSTMGLHGMNYNVYLAQAEKYAEEMLEIDKQLADDPYNQTLIERRQELLELQQEMILASEDEKQAIVDMVEEGIEIELDALDELINKYTEALDAKKDEYEYGKKIKEQTKEIAMLEKQLASYSNDMSEESKAKIQELKVSLEDAREDLEETEYEQYISDQKKLLDELYNEYELILNQRLDNIDALIADMIGSINTNSAIIYDTLSMKADEVGYTLSDVMTTTWNTASDVIATYGQGIQNSILNAATSLSSVFSGYVSGIQNMIASLNSSANSNVQSGTVSSSVYSSQSQSNIYDASTAINATSSSTSGNKSSGSNSSNKSNNSSSSKTSNSSNSGVDFVYAKNYSKNLNASTSVVDRLKSNNFSSSFSDRSDYYNQMGFSGTYTGSASQNTKMLEWLKTNGYRNGKYRLSKDELAWTQEGRKMEAIIRPSDGAILTPLAKNDSVLSAFATSNIFDFANDPNAFIRDNLNIGNSISSVPSQNVIGNTYDNDFSMQVVLPNVQNYEQFKYAMQHDKNFEKMVRAMTVDKMFGGSSLKKYNY